MRVWLSWSSGKDSAFALHVLRGMPGVEVVGLFTTLNGHFDRVAMHAVRRTLLKQQAAAVGLALTVAELPWPCSDEEYAAIMVDVVATARNEGIESFAFGDLFLEDIRRYREAHLAGTGLTPLFPLWDRPTRELAEEMIAIGMRATLTCVDPRALGPAFAGRAFDTALLRELPPAVDPCGENGEFHTFVWDGPMMAGPVPVRTGQVTERDGFVFADLRPNDQPVSAR